MAGLLVSVFLVMVSACDVSYHGPISPGKSMTTLTDLGLWLVQYRIKDERLDFAVIAGPGPKDRNYFRAALP